MQPPNPGYKDDAESVASKDITSTQSSAPEEFDEELSELRGSRHDIPPAMLTNGTADELFKLAVATTTESSLWYANNHGCRPLRSMGKAITAKHDGSGRVEGKRGHAFHGLQAGSGGVETTLPGYVVNYFQGGRRCR